MAKLILLSIIAILATLGPLALGVVACFKIKRGDTLHWWQCMMMGCAVIFSSVAVFMAPSVPMLVSAIILAGIVLCCMLGLTWAFRKVTRLSIFKSAILSTIPIVLFLLWLDLRFCVLVVDTNGLPREVQSGDVALHRPNRHYFQTYLTHDGHRLTAGRTYFGLLTWLQYKDDWTFSGSFVDKNGHFLGDLKWKPARWSEWPKVVVVDPERN